MILSLRLQNFRSYTNRSFNFTKSSNIIVGPNAIGKTNILEAILVSRTGNSYRAKDIDLIAFKSSWARIEAKEDDGLRIVKISKDATKSKSFEINGQIYKRLPARLRLPVVFFEPNHLQLLNGPPDGRRGYLDNFIDQIDPEYGPTLRKYYRSLLQRNSLLKNPIRPTDTQLFPWNIRLSQLAGRIVGSRQSLVDKINKNLPTIYGSLSKDKLKTKIVYQPQLPAKNYGSNFLKKLETNIEEDLRSGFTTHGPHRDDFSFMFNNHSSNTYASRGELRTAVLALKIVELETIKSTLEAEPVVLLDDVYSELDNTRRKALTSYLKDNQSFITTTDADLVSRQLVGNKVIKI